MGGGESQNRARQSATFAFASVQHDAARRARLLQFAAAFDGDNDRAARGYPQPMDILRRRRRSKEKVSGSQRAMITCASAVVLRV